MVILFSLFRALNMLSQVEEMSPSCWYVVSLVRAASFRTYQYVLPKYVCLLLQQHNPVMSTVLPLHADDLRILCLSHSTGELSVSVCVCS